MKQKIVAVTVRPIKNFDEFNPKSFHASHWKWGFKKYLLAEKVQEALDQAKEVASYMDSICVGFVNTDDDSEKYPLVERLEDSGLMKFVFLNAAPCEEQEADVYILYKTKHDIVKFEQYLKFEPGSIA